MQRPKIIRIFALAIGVLLLFFFIFIPLLGHIGNSYLDRHPSEIPLSDWKKFSSDEGKFSVWFPGAPERTNIVISTPSGDISQTYFFFRGDRQTQYFVNYADYPQNLVKLKPEQQFDLSQAAVAKKYGEIIYQQDIKLKDYPGREFEFAANRGKANFSGRMRLILVNQRLYQLGVIFLTANPHPADREIFFNSFKLLN